MNEQNKQRGMTRREALVAAGIAAAALPLLLRSGGRTARTPTMRFTSHVPRSHALYGLVYQPFFKKVHEATQGRVLVEPYMDKLLHGPSDGFKACLTGITDFTHGYASYQPHSFRLLHALQLPFLFPSSNVAALVAEELYPRYFKTEYEAMGVYLAHCDATAAYDLISRRPVLRLEDMKGIKVRTAGGLGAAVYRELGAVPVTLPAAEVYEAFQRGLVDAVALSAADIYSYRLYEVGKHFTALGLSTTVLQYCFRKDSFDRLAEEDRSVLYRLLRERSQMASRNYYAGPNATAALASFRDKGVAIHELTSQERQRWAEAVEPMHRRFVKENEARGLPGEALLSELRALVERYASWTPDQLLHQTIHHPVRGIIDTAA